MPTINLGRVRGNDGDTNVDTVVEYTEPSSYEEPASGDTIRTLFSKIAKGLSELFNTKIDKANISHNLLTTNPDMVLGADMGKVLNDRLENIDASNTWKTLQTGMPGVTINLLPTTLNADVIQTFPQLIGAKEVVLEYAGHFSSLYFPITTIWFASYWYTNANYGAHIAGRFETTTGLVAVNWKTKGAMQEYTSPVRIRYR